MNRGMSLNEFRPIISHHPPYSLHFKECSPPYDLIWFGPDNNPVNPAGKDHSPDCTGQETKAQGVGIMEGTVLSLEARVLWVLPPGAPKPLHGIEN